MSDDVLAAARPAATWRTWARRLAPWLITGAAVFFILREYPIDKIAEEMARGSALPMLPVALALPVSLLFLVSAWDAIVLVGFLGGPRYRDVLRGKAGMSMLLTLGYGFGHGGYAVWIARVTGASIGRTAGAALYISASDLCALATVSTLTIHLGGAEVPRGIAIAAPAIAGALYFFALTGPFRLIRGMPAVFLPWGELSRVRQIGNILGRAFNIVLMISATWLAADLFGLGIPYGVMMSYLPLVILVGSLPINVAGFGPVQGAWLVFEPWAAGAAILAFQFLWHLMLAGGLVARGLPFIRRVIAEIAEGRRLTQSVGQDS